MKSRVKAVPPAARWPISQTRVRDDCMRQSNPRGAEGTRLWIRVGIRVGIRVDTYRPRQSWPGVYFPKINRGGKA